MKSIPLYPNGNEVALVDDQDFDKVQGFRWRVLRGYKGSASYVVTTFNRQSILMHRLLMNAQPGQMIDHINGNGFDNRRSNLRLCTASENQHNMHARWGASPYKGIYLHKKGRLWHARIKHGGKRISLGYYHDEVSAAKAYDEAAIRLCGEFANTNFGGGVDGGQIAYQETRPSDG